MSGTRQMNLAGKTAIVTGAARGLGQAYAKAMAAEGMNVVVADREDVGGTLAALGPKAAGTRVDVADFKSVAAMTALALAKWAVSTCW